jgi:hypothetical protein
MTRTAYPLPTARGYTVPKARVLLAPFSPSGIAGCELWLEADSIVANDGDSISTWTATIGTNATVSTAQPPSYQTNEISGLPVVRFNGVDESLRVVGLVNNDATRTLFVVARNRVVTAGRGVVGWTNGTASLIQGTTATGVMRWRLNAAAADVDIGTPAAPLNPWLVTVRFNSTSSADAYFDMGSAVNFDPDDGYQTPGTSPFGLGGRTPTQGFANVDIGEVIIFSGALSAGDLDSVRTYLYTKWLLPPAGAAHPLKYRSGGSFNTKPLKIRSGGTFVEKTLKRKSGGTF